MRIVLGSVDIDDESRRLFNKHFGKPGLATRKALRSYLVDFGTSTSMASSMKCARPSGRLRSLRRHFLRRPGACATIKPAE